MLKDKIVEMKVMLKKILCCLTLYLKVSPYLNFPVAVLTPKTLKHQKTEDLKNNCTLSKAGSKIIN